MNNSHAVTPIAAMADDSSNTARRRRRQHASSRRNNAEADVQQAAQCLLDIQSGTKRLIPKHSFNLLHALICRPELMELTARWLDPNSLGALYTASRSFHYIMNTRYHYYIRGCASIWAPFGEIAFPHHSFRELCLQDPGARPIPFAEEQVRHIPGVKWLKMAASRQNVVDEILAVLDRAGHRLPRDTHITLQKMWFTMSIAGNGARIGLLHNRDYWTDQDLYLAVHFFIKFDMFCTDPVDGTGEHTLRDVFLSKRSLVPLHALLHGEYSPLAILQHYVAYDYRLIPGQRHLSVLGIPAHLVGQGCREGWGAGSERSLSVAEGVMLEAVRRRLQMNQYFLDMMLYGYSEIADNIAFPLKCKKPRDFGHMKNVDWHMATYGIKEV